MNPADLDAAIAAATASADALQAAFKASGPVESMILIPLVQQAAQAVNTLQALKAAIREAQQ